MKKQELDKIASDTFKSFPDAEKCFVTTDGQAFLSNNAASLHKNTNKKAKDLKVVEYSNPSIGEKQEGGKGGSNTEVEFPLTEKAVKAMKLTDLQKMAEDLKIDIKELDTKAKIADAINELKSKS
ncbi:hypothetical protein [Allomuricauda sp. M10]|uniref:hypothetical protein n=1 Tax=Allomuricauda sp. M10 TaxID=2683292 RepID=UPI001D196E63|nr:hypothetical protein [Muricauda sp. M10]